MRPSPDTRGQTRVMLIAAVAAANLGATGVSRDYEVPPPSRSLSTTPSASLPVWGEISVGMEAEDRVPWDRAPLLKAVGTVRMSVRHEPGVPDFDWSL